MRVFLGAIIALLLGPCAAFTAGAEPSHLTSYAGRWAVKAEGQNLMVLVLELPRNSNTLAGVLYRPTHMNLNGRTVSSVSLPVKEDPVVRAELEPDGLHLGIQGDDGSPVEFQMVLENDQSAELKYVGIPVSPIPLVRVGEDDAVGQVWDSRRSYAISNAGTDNATMTHLFEEDQADRKQVPLPSPGQIADRDFQRRQAVNEMLWKDELHTGTDFLHAAFIFQHGNQPRDFLLAHTLALSALAQGRADASWIAAASLDRYLLADGKPQIYGTQFSQGQEERLDAQFMPDVLRIQMGVPATADQKAPAAAPVSGCSTISGDASLWTNPRIRYIMVGETHGTVEEPALFGDLVCGARVSGRPIVVALEQAEDQQPSIDSYLSSNGKEAARRAFMSSPLWAVSPQDGRSSGAYFDLFERLRRLRQAEIITGVVAIQPLLTHEGSGSDPDFEMAKRIRNISTKNPNALIFVLVGNVHARRVPLGLEGRTIAPAASYLPGDETISLMIVAKGEAWNCSGNDCGVHALVVADTMKRGVILVPGAATGFDGFLGVGKETTASPPAK